MGENSGTDVRFGRKSFYAMLKHVVAIGVAVVCLVTFIKLVIGPFTDWNFSAESVLFEAMSYFWQDHFDFFRLLHFNWHSDCFLYPYGIDITFINWAFEMGVFFTFTQKLGIAAWGQWYYLYSLALTFFGTYLLLWRRKGWGWALFFAFVLTFCNYAATCKFPCHYALCIVHWGILSVVLDVILVEKFWANEHISARFILIKTLVLLLCFGLELGYIAGFACFSFFIVGCFLLLSKLVQTKSFVQTWKWVVGEALNIIRTFTVSRWNIILLFLVILVAWVYLPVIFQIMTHTPPQGKTVIWETNPLRIFHPIFPGYNPAVTFQTRQGFMGWGLVDTIYAWSAGLSALLFCCFGVVAGGFKGVKKWLPFCLITLGALLMYHFPVATYFPAFKYARIPERFSPYLSCLLLVPLILAPYCRCPLRFPRCGWITAASLACLLWVIEIWTAYAQTFFWSKDYRPAPFTSECNSAFEIVRQLPGEALFFMPFSSGDGQGGFDSTITAHQMQFAARCGKKVNSCYIGRMFPDLYLKDFYRIPWRLFMDGRTWTPQMWNLLKSYFMATDFAACVIDKKAFTDEQYADIVRHLGASVASFDLDKQRYEVFPLPSALRGGKKDMDAVLNLEMGSALTACEAKISERPVEIWLQDGFSAVEPWGVWSVRKECSLSVRIPSASDGLQLIVKAQAYMRTKRVQVYSGEQKLAEWNMTGPLVTPADYVVAIPSELTGRRLELRLVQDDVVAPCEVDPANGDTRTLGIGLISMRLANEEK